MRALLISTFLVSHRLQGRFVEESELIDQTGVEFEEKI